LERLVHPSRERFDLRARREGERPALLFGYDPEVAARVAERVLEQQRVIVEQGLNGLDRQRPRPDERRVARICRIDLRLEIAHVDLAIVRLVDERDRRRRVRMLAHRHLQFGQPRAPLVAHASKLRGKARWHTRPRVEVAFDNLVEQPPRERLLVEYQRAAGSI
jgi:hypothetical protein